MPVDVSVVPDLTQPPTADTAGFWMRRLQARLSNQDRVRRLEVLDSWHRGTPPLPPGAEGSEAAYRAFQQYARSNFAGLIVEAPRERMQPIGIRTSADGDDTGDAEAWRIWRRANMQTISADIHRGFLRFGECPVIVGPINPRTEVPTITAEDPRQMVIECDPVDGSEMAGFKTACDDITGIDVAYLYRPGRIDVAIREGRKGGEARPYGRIPIAPRFDARSWTLVPDEGIEGVPVRSMQLPDPDLMPAVLFANLDYLAEFEPHLDLLSRINHMILQRLVIAVMQAFRQRWADGLPAKDDQGRPINWADVFAPGAGAFWSLPPGVTLHELGQVDLTPMLSAVSDDLKHLAAVSRTPMHMLDPSGANQSAEGAALSREGLVFRTEDRISRATAGYNRLLRNAFLWLEDTKRADLNGLDVIWAPPARASLSERCAAAAQAVAAGVPWRTVMIDVMGFAPDHVDRMTSERDDDLLFAQQLATVKAASVPTPASAASSTSTIPAPVPGNASTQSGS